MTQKRIAVIVGSLRRESFNRKMAGALMVLAPESMEFEIIEIGLLPLYNEDLDNDTPPAAWTEFRERVSRFDGVLFVTPEYNRVSTGCPQECPRCGFPTLWEKRLERKARRCDERLTGCDRRIRRKPSFAPVAGVPERSSHAAARGLHRQCLHSF